MDSTQKLAIIQKVYAGVLADSVKHLAQAGVLAPVTAAKRAEQLAGGAARAAQMGLKDPVEAFTTTADIFQCADWKEVDATDGRTVEASRCLLCALSKRLGSPSPCRIYCLDPLEGMVRGLAPDLRFEVEETLFEGTRCRVRLRTA